MAARSTPLGARSLAIPTVPSSMRAGYRRAGRQSGIGRAASFARAAVDAGVHDCETLRVVAAALRLLGGNGQNHGRNCRARWSASRTAKATIMKVEFACPDVTNAELLAT